MKRLIIIAAVIFLWLPISPAYPYWIWTPKTGKWVNPKTMVKPSPKEQFDYAKEFYELKKYEDSIDQRIPVNSVIYFKNTEEIIFSNKENIDAEKTAFSAYSKFGIELLLITNYYYLPKKQLAKKEVFMHSLMVAEKSNDIRDLIFVALFLAKYKKELAGINHSIVKNLNRVLSGEKIPGYPSLAEIKDRARIYNIKV